MSIVTVTNAASGFRLTTLDRVKSELGISGTADDTLLGAKIDEASAAVTLYCDRVFALETVSEQFRLTSCVPSLILARRPVVTLGAIVEDGLTLADADREIDKEAGLLYRLDGQDARCEWPALKITVSYSAGYVLPGNSGRNLPYDIEACCIELVRGYWMSRDRDPLVKREVIPDVSELEFWVGTGPLLDSLQRAIGKYRNWTAR